MNYEILENTCIDPEMIWRRMRYLMNTECQNQYKSLMMAKINKRSFDPKRLVTDEVKTLVDNKIEDKVVIDVAAQVIKEVVKSSFKVDEILGYYSGTKNVYDFDCVQQYADQMVCYFGEGDIENIKKDKSKSVEKNLMDWETKIYSIVTDVLSYRKYGAFTPVEFRTLVLLVRGQVLINKTKAVMEIPEILDLDVLSVIVKKFMSERPNIPLIMES